MSSYVALDLSLMRLLFREGVGAYRDRCDRQRLIVKLALLTHRRRADASPRLEVAEAVARREIERSNQAGVRLGLPA